MGSPVVLVKFPVIDYDDAWRWQIEAAASAQTAPRYESLALLQHPPVYTFGRRARYEHLLIEPDELRARGAGIIESDRGGDITFHGPGQLVVYPILNLKARALGPVDYVRRLEETVILTLESFSLRCERVPGRPGVWLQEGKVAALGVRVKSGISMHGFALNVTTDLSWFDAIVPCGIRDAGVTSMQRALGAAPAFAAVEDAVCDAFSAVFDVELTPAQTSISREAVLSHGR